MSGFSTRIPSSGRWMVISPLSPISDSVDSSPGNPKQWSPWRWLMKIRRRRLSLMPYFMICICVPSPQSIINRLPRKSMICDVGICRGVGFADAQPRIVTLKGSIICANIQIFSNIPAADVKSALYLSNCGSAVRVICSPVMGWVNVMCRAWSINRGAGEASLP